MAINKSRVFNSSGWFLDSGNLDEIKKWRPFIGGITTNQLILFKNDGVLNIPTHFKKIFKIVGPNFPVSVELPYSKASKKEMISLAKKYFDLAPKNTVIKVPIIPNDMKGLEVVHELSKMGIPTNSTIGINEAQLMLAAEATRNYKGKRDNYISLFWGRSMESDKRGESNSPEVVLTNLIAYLKNHELNTRIIVGSIREVSQIYQAFTLGADIVTIPPKILNNIMVTSRALETVDEFDQAYLDVKDNPKLKLV